MSCRRGAGFAILPTVGGQTALNLAIELSDGGVLEKHNVQLIGANVAAIKKAEDRLYFKDAMQKIGLDVPKSALVNNLKDGLEFAGKIGFPVIVRPSFTLGGSGGGIAYNREEMLEVLARGLDFSPVHEALIEESVLGVEGIRARGDARPRQITSSSSARLRTSIRWECIPAIPSPSLPSRH